MAFLQLAREKGEGDFEKLGEDFFGEIPPVLHFVNNALSEADHRLGVFFSFSHI